MWSGAAVTEAYNDCDVSVDEHSECEASAREICGGGEEGGVGNAEVSVGGE